MSLFEFHRVIQIAFGWADTHLHAFSYGKRRFLLPQEDDEYDFGFPNEDNNENEFSLASLHLDIFKNPFRYMYDFGDDWLINIVLEKKIEGTLVNVPVPFCIKAAGNSPPEDSGGMWGYYKKLEILAQPNDPEHKRVKKWMPTNFDPGFVDIEGINEALVGEFNLRG